MQNELLVRADAIAEMLGQDKPEEFCALNCRGFFHDVRRSALGLVFDYPQTASSFQSQKEPRSLQHLLTETFRNSKFHPTLDDKIWVAHRLDHVQGVHPHTGTIALHDISMDRCSDQPYNN